MKMEKLNDVWKFVEEKINCTVPAYFKNILKACGYENAITIASIEEEDVHYFEEEVRSGTVSKYYEGMETVNILDGSTKTEANFENTRGHKKFLMFISDYLKDYFKKNASNTVTSPLNSVSRKNFNIANGLSQTLNINLPSKNQKDITDRDIKLQQGILMCEVIMSLINTTPELFVAVISKSLRTDRDRPEQFKFHIDFQNMDSINNKIAYSHELVKLKIKQNKLLEAIIYCPVCSKPTTAFHKSSNDNKFTWNVSNFVDHLHIAHQNYKEQIDSKPIMRHVEDLMWALGHRNDNANVEDNRFIKSDIEKFKSQELLWKKSVHNKSKDRDVVQLPDTSEEDVKDQSYSNILKEGMGSPKAIRLQSLYEVPGSDELIQTISPQLGNYVVCLLLVKDTIKWPSTTSIRKNFVGKICILKEDVPNDEHADEREEMFNILFLIKKRHSNFIFYYPQQVETTRISRSKIVKILPDPVQNRRGGLVFKDTSMTDYVF